MAIVKINDSGIYTHRWLLDVERIQRVLLANGYSSLLEDCGRLWDDHSDDYCAGWLGLPEDDEDLWGELQNLIYEK